MVNSSTFWMWLCLEHLKLYSLFWGTSYKPTNSSWFWHKGHKHAIIFTIKKYVFCYFLILIPKLPILQYPYHREFRVPISLQHLSLGWGKNRVPRGNTLKHRENMQTTYTGWMQESNHWRYMANILPTKPPWPTKFTGMLKNALHRQTLASNAK